MFSLQILLGRVCTIAGLQNKELPIAFRAIDNAQFDCPSTSQKSVDHVAKSYLQDLLIEISKAGGGELLPVNVEGDGFCLTHAISKFFFGIEIFYHVIRSKIHAELDDNAEWYMGRQNTSCKVTTDFNEVLVDDVTVNVGCNNREITVDKSSVSDNLEGNANHFCPAFTIEEYYEVLQAAVPDYADLVVWSPLAHCQVLSNILKRPVCLFTSLQDLDRGESFIFLPLRHPAKDCYKHPVTIAWQGRGKNGELSHFVPLCRTLDSSAPKIPSNCQPAFYRCSRSIGKQYINHDLDGSFSTGIPVLFSEVQSTHLFKTMGYRFKPHKPEQPGFFHGLIDKLIEKAFQELSVAFSDKNSSFSSSSTSIKMSLSGDNDCQHEDSKMTATNLFIKLYVSRLGFEVISVCAASHPEVLSITHSFEIISNNIITDYSNQRIQQKRNCASTTTNTIPFKLEIDEHVVAGMERLRGMCVARTRYLQYLQAMHVKNLIILEYEKFLSKLSKNIPSLNDVTPASSRRIFPNSSASPSTSSLSQSLSRVSDDGNLFSTELQDMSQIHVLKNLCDFPTSIPLTLSPDDNDILLHLLQCKKLAVEYYHDSKGTFIETYLCSESDIHSNIVIRNDKTEASASRLQCIEIIAAKTLPDNSHSFHPWKSNKSSDISLEGKINLELNRKRNISEL